MGVPEWRRVSRGEGMAFRRLRTVTGLYHDVMIEQGVRMFHEDTIEIGPLTYIGHGALLHGDPRGGISIGRHCWIGFKAMLFGQAGIEIGDDVGIGSGVQIITGKHNVREGSGPIQDRPQVWGKVRIGDGSDIGVGAIILPGVTIGKCAQIAAGAVVCKDVADFEICAGVPGGRVGTVANDDDS